MGDIIKQKLLKIIKWISFLIRQNSILFHNDIYLNADCNNYMNVSGKCINCGTLYYQVWEHFNWLLGHLVIWFKITFVGFVVWPQNTMSCLTREKQTRAVGLTEAVTIWLEYYVKFMKCCLKWNFYNILLFPLQIRVYFSVVCIMLHKINTISLCIKVCIKTYIHTSKQNQYVLYDLLFYCVTHCDIVTNLILDYIYYHYSMDKRAW